ncbi:MAG: hypothetical protein K2J66_07160, partial [Muribaculaceae bacterium]|nr:hypothetical protein [Muribaculaceae bacterium]
IIICVLIPISIKAENNASITLSMQSQPIPQTGHNKQDEPEGRRIPPKPIYCTISTEGINVAGLSEDIMTYELWNETSEICLASFNGENEFLDFLFNQSGEFQIIFITDNYCISGYIVIN